MKMNLMRLLLIALLAMTFSSCVGVPCEENQDADCLTESTGLVCNMAVPAEDPENGTCQYPGEIDDICGESADCAAGACLPDVMNSAMCEAQCCDGACMEHPACTACILLKISEYAYCAVLCCGGSCLEAPTCQACMAPFYEDMTCKSLVGDACEKNSDCQELFSFSTTCYEAETLCVVMEPGNPCDDQTDCISPLVCDPSSRQCL